MLDLELVKTGKEEEKELLTKNIFNEELKINLKFDKDNYTCFVKKNTITYDKAIASQRKGLVVKKLKTYNNILEYYITNTSSMQHKSVIRYENDYTNNFIFILKIGIKV